MSQFTGVTTGQWTGEAPTLTPPARQRTIVVPLDGSPEAMAALPVARALADLEGAAVHVVHVSETILPPQEAASRLGLERELGRGLVVEQATGPAAASIVRFARDRQGAFIVAATHTTLVATQGQLGPVAAEMLCSAPCPVVLVRPDFDQAPWVLRRILLPHDGTPSTAIAIGPATELAQRSDAELIVLHVAAPGATQSSEPGSMAAPRYVDQPQHEFPAWAAEFLDRLCGLGHKPESVRMRLFLGKGEPGAEIVSYAREYRADLIALGWHGRLKREHATTLRAVVEGAPCPVLFMRAAVQ